MKNWAQVAKSIVASAESVDVGVVGQGRPLARHATTGSGDLLFSLVEAAPACAHLVTAGATGPDILATAADVSAMPHAGRVRGVVRLGGRAELMPTPLDEQLRDHLGLPADGLVARLTPTSITLDWRVEAPEGRIVMDVRPEDYRPASVDALVGWQDEWISHLDAHHREDLRRLVDTMAALHPASMIRPMIADEYGFVVREFMDEGYRDIRVPFPRVVHCGCEAVQALNGMLELAR